MFFRHLDPARMFALDHTQLAGLNPHTASFIRSDFIRDPVPWISFDFPQNFAQARPAPSIHIEAETSGNQSCWRYNFTCD